MAMSLKAAEISTRLLEAAERSRRVSLVVAVDEHSAGSEPLRDGERARQVLREDARREPVFGGVRTPQQRVEVPVTRTEHMIGCKEYRAVEYSAVNS